MSAKRVRGSDVDLLTTGLTREEDAELRRLHELVQYADTTSLLVERYRQLRERDRRHTVRALSDEELAHVVAPAGLPRQRTPYPDEPD